MYNFVGCMILCMIVDNFQITLYHGFIKLQLVTENLTSKTRAYVLASFHEFVAARITN